MIDKLRFILNRISEKLWVRPLVLCFLSIAGAFIAKMADGMGLEKWAFEIELKSVETLLSVLSSSILVIATLAVASMVSAYASAANTATPRSFTLVVSDDVSQNALSAFIGAFIFSIVATIVLENSYYGKAGLFALFILTLLVFTVVILTFVRWVDNIARLGRLGTTINKVESATISALQRRKKSPTLGGKKTKSKEYEKIIYGKSIGYIQHIDIAVLQNYAEETKINIVIAALPGTFTAPDRAIAYIDGKSDSSSKIDFCKIEQAFMIGDERKFDEDPRFGLVVLSEIASRALSPAVNDPGTAIQIISKFVRLFSTWHNTEEDSKEKVTYDRVAVPDLSVDDMFEDAFSAIARDSRDIVEVHIRIQKALKSLASLAKDDIKKAACRQSKLALVRAEQALTCEDDIKRIQDLAKKITAS